MSRSKETRQAGTDELSIQFAILERLKNGAVWTNAELKSVLRKEFEWPAEDLKVGARPNEYKWENRINNALSPSRSSSLYAKGHVQNRGHGEHQITEKGLKFINEDFDLDDFLSTN